MTSPRPVERSPSRPWETRQPSVQTVSEYTHPPRCSAVASGCSNTRHSRDTSLFRLARLTGVSRRVLRVRGQGCSVPVRPPCAPQTPEPGQVRGMAGHLGNTGIMESGNTETSQSSAQFINTDTLHGWGVWACQGDPCILLMTTI